MIDLDGMPEDEIRDIFNQLFFEERYPAFAGSKVRSEGGWGQIVVPVPFGPEFEGKRVACVGAEYRIIGLNLGNECCPHFAIGKLVTGAANILYQGVPIAMVGSRGVHADGCGTKSVVVTEGYRKIERPGESYEFFPM